MEYRILQEIYSSGTVTRYKVIGDGFLSLNALWMGVASEMARRLADPPVKISLQLEKVENQETIVIGKLQLDDSPTLKELINVLRMPI